MACDCQTFFTNLNLSYLDTYDPFLCGENGRLGGFFDGLGVRDSPESDLRCQLNQTPVPFGGQKGVNFCPKKPGDIAGQSG